MTVSIIMTSVGGWEKYAKPAVDSIRRKEPDVEIIWVDAGDLGPDEYKDVQIIKTPIISYTEALNVAVSHSKNPWILSMDTDILCVLEFVYLFEELDEDTIYGNKYIHSRDYLKHPDYGWFDGWIMAINKKVFEDIGLFDEKLIAAGFEDADFCFRAQDAGYNLQQYDFPFYHLAAGQKYDAMKDYDKKRLQNIAYVKKKWGL